MLLVVEVVSERWKENVGCRRRLGRCSGGNRIGWWSCSSRGCSYRMGCPINEAKPLRNGEAVAVVVMVVGVVVVIVIGKIVVVGVVVVEVGEGIVVV